MGLLGGGFLRLLQTFLYGLAFCCSGIILGVYSYFLAVLSDRNINIDNNWKAITGMSGIGVVYTAFAIILTCCLGGVSFFGFVATVLNVAFAGAFIAIAVLGRDGAGSCSGDNIRTPINSGSATDESSGFGSGGFGTDSSTDSNTTYAASVFTACRLNKAAFAVAIIGAFLFLILAVVQVFLVRRGKKEKRFGPSPANNYTSGTPRRRFPWQRKKNVAAAGVGAGAATHHHGNRDMEMGGVDTRPSHDTAYTGSTMAAPHQTGLVKDAEPVGHSAHGRYYTQPEGTGVNPYGYENQAPARNF